MIEQRADALGETRLAEEEVLDPEQPIIDAHHHLYNRANVRYLLPEFLSDLRSGHNVCSTVYVQARAMYRRDGSKNLQPIGETEFATSIAAEVERDPDLDVRVCEGIVGYANLQLGEAVRDVLEAHVEAGEGRFRGIRHIVAWDPDRSLLNPAYPTSKDMLEREDFRAGFAQLEALGLSFDAWLFFHQLDQLAALARDFPNTPIILNHCGGILGTGRYAHCREDVFTAWRSGMLDLARCPNISVKIGGFGMELFGLMAEEKYRHASSSEIAEGWRPWAETCIQAFGTQRCMFESNFPVDRSCFSYRTVWNAMKRLTGGASRDEKDDLFWRSASRIYRLNGSISRPEAHGTAGVGVHSGSSADATAIEGGALS